MAILKKFDITGKDLGGIDIEEELLLEEANGQMIKDYLVAIRKNCRQWSASTQGRSEVNSTKKKPHAQKGTGRARQGFIGAPQYRGGGRVFGPKPKFDQHVRINKKERRKAITFLLSSKIKENQVRVLAEADFEEPKTKRTAAFLKALQIEGKRVLFLGECIPGEEAGERWFRNREGLIKSLRNIPRVKFALVPNISGYDVALFQEIVLLEGAVEEFKSILGK